MSDRYADPGDVKVREFAYTTFVFYAKAAESETIATVSKPDFWAHLTKRIKVGDVAEVLADDGSFEWHGRATSKGVGEVYFREIFRWERPADVVEAKAPPAEYTVEWGGAHKHRIRTPDNKILKFGFSSQDEAKEYLRKFLAGEIQEAA